MFDKNFDHLKYLYRAHFTKEISSNIISDTSIYLNACDDWTCIFLLTHLTWRIGNQNNRRQSRCWSSISAHTLLLQSWFWRRLCPPTRLCDGGTEGGWFWFRLRWVLIWTRSVSQALAPWGGASPASPLAGEGGPTIALGGNDRPGPDTTGAPLPLPIRAPVSPFFGHDCIGHGQPWKAAAQTVNVWRLLSLRLYRSRKHVMHDD